MITVGFPWPGLRLVAPYHVISCYIPIEIFTVSNFPPAPHLSTGSIRLKDAVDLLDVRPRAVGQLPSIAQARPDNGRRVGKTMARKPWLVDVGGIIPHVISWFL